MEWQPTPYTAPLVAAAVLSVVITGYAVFRRRRDNQALVDAFIGVAFGAGMWAGAYALQLSASGLDSTLFWNQFVWAGIGLLAVAWPVFVLVYLGWTNWVTVRYVAALSVVPLSVVFTVFVLDTSTLFYQAPHLIAPRGYSVLAYTPRPALLAFMAYTYVVNLLTFVALGYAVLVREGERRRQALVVLFAGVTPAVVGIVGLVTGLGPVFVDLTPITFAVTSVALGWIVFRHQLLDITPVARDAVFTHLTDGVIVINADERIVDYNRPAADLFTAIAVGKHVSEAFADVPSVARAVTTAPATDDLRITISGDAGAPRFLTLSLHRIGEQPQAGGCVLLFRDITERETLQRRYRTLIEKSPNVIGVVGNDGLLQYVSPSIERILGHHPTEVEGRPVLDLVHPEDREAAQHAFECAFDDAEPRPIEHRIAHADGSWRRFETVAEQLFDGAQEAVITATDITDSHRYEQRLQVLNRVLRHDLKNDTNVIGGYVSLLRDHVDATGDEYLDIIDRNVDTLTHLSDQARQIDVALHSSTERAAIDLTDLVPRLCGTLDSSFQDADISVSTPDTAVVCSDTLLESAVRNVLENAVVHNDRDEPTVAVTVTADRDGYQIDVRDDGPGIPPVERAVFTAERETPLEHASGLGLWLVHWIVTESGGELQIDDSCFDRGTLVSIWLPSNETS